MNREGLNGARTSLSACVRSTLSLICSRFNVSLVLRAQGTEWPRSARYEKRVLKGDESQDKTAIVLEGLLTAAATRTPAESLVELDFRSRVLSTEL